MNSTVTDIYLACDVQLRPLLESVGFNCVQAGEFIRADNQGEDRVLVDADPRKGRVAVLMSYYPVDFDVIERLNKSSNEPQGFPCGPYLSPHDVGRNQYWWPCKTQVALCSASEKMKAAMQDRGLPWLQGLRDPIRFSLEVDPIAALYSAYAHERAGNFGKARERYEEMHRRLLAGMNFCVSEAEFIKTAGREYVFVAKKLGFDCERVLRFEHELGETLNIISIDVIDGG